MNVFAKLHINAPRYSPIYSSNCYYNNFIFDVYHGMKNMRKNPQPLRVS